jgi:hypothetical protein
MLTLTSSPVLASRQRCKTVHRMPPVCGYMLVASRFIRGDNRDLVDHGVDATLCINELAGHEAREMVVDKPHDLDYKVSKLGAHGRYSSRESAL